ncbi:hypothetical protein A0J61_10240 [Choanephora cucurbitarum]|uniref:Uncharacterized protein n=1 Tax=Choanephora cucurbitarum TaxID=101091 RepID=A0A1C7MY02_9FUNG|nr:hypothetical protein A0J61_10240 [Choanephora cucurbitarum]
MNSERETLEIVQTQLNQCEQQKRRLVERMTNKRMVLTASHGMLHHLQYALKEDKGKEREKKRELPTDGLVPILTNRVHESPKEESEDAFCLGHCVGWVRNRRIWIQAYLTGPCHPNAYLVCLDSLALLPDKMMTGHDQHHAWLGFDLLPDTSPEAIESMRIALSDQPSQSCSIEWKSDQDTSWQKFIRLSIHIYFPCQVSMEFSVDWQEWIQHAQVSHQAHFVYLNTNDLGLV